MQSIAVMSSGGDAPGMNAAIRAVTRAALARDAKVWGILDGFNGLVNGEIEQLTSRGVSGILQRGGSILGAGRSEEFLDAQCRIGCIAYLREQKIEGLIVIGGDGSLRGGQELHTLGLPVVVVPGSIDNDVPGTEMCIGTDTALNTAVTAIDSVRDTASAHHRAMIVEVMGRHSGYLAAMAGLATGAEMVITPEWPVTLEDIFREMQVGEERGKRHFIIVLAEGAPWPAEELTRLINEADNPFDARHTVLGYTQRGGAPSAFDRILATRMGVAAADALLAGETGVLIALNGGKIISRPIEELEPKGLQRNADLERVQLIMAT